MNAPRPLITLPTGECMVTERVASVMLLNGGSVLCVEHVDGTNLLVEGLDPAMGQMFAAMVTAAVTGTVTL